MNINIENDEILTKIRDNFNEDIYLVGGAVRDILQDKQPLDRDLVIADTCPKNFALKLSEFFNGTFIELDSENEIYRIVLPDKINYLDITKPVGGILEEDLKQRDLTINSLALDLHTGEIIDKTRGISDFKNGILHVYDEKSIPADPLRLLRIFRFQAIYGFKIDTETEKFIEKYKNLILLPAHERRIYEILRLFEGKYSDIALLNLDKFGILEKLFPFVTEYKKVPPNTHHHLNLFYHCIETVKQIQNIYENEQDLVKSHLEENVCGQTNRLSHLKFAGFMHDLGKFSTWTIDFDGRHRFIKHDDVGAKLAQKFLTEQKFSKKQILYLTTMIKYHIYPSSVMSSPEITEKIMMRFVRKMENNALDIITLAKADRLSARGDAISEEMVNQNIENLETLKNFYLAKKDTLKPLEKLLTGLEIAEILSIKPSKELGEIIEKLHEAQLNGDVVKRCDAVDFVKKLKD